MLDASSGHRSVPGYDKVTFGFGVTISLKELREGNGREYGEIVLSINFLCLLKLCIMWKRVAQDIFI